MRLLNEIGSETRGFHPPCCHFPTIWPQSALMDFENEKDPQRVLDLLNQNQQFAFVIRKAQGLLSLQKLINELLPPELQICSRVVNVHGSCLVLATSSGANATRLHYLAPELIQSLRFHDQWRHIQTIQARVMQL